MFELAGKGGAAAIYIDPEGAHREGLSLAASALGKDLEAVCGTEAKVLTVAPSGLGAIIVGILGEDRVIDGLAAEGRLDVSAIRGRRECYRMSVVETPAEGLRRALVIAGSDKRGAIYGIFRLSELIGVSPWAWWADAAPTRKESLVFDEKDLDLASREPSVRYRGIFLNDEWPSLGTWVMGAFGGFNEKFYGKVFELILRLKGNYLWPAMWSARFSEDGESEPLANARLADAWGIVMGSSHHEPMCRAGEEWKKINSRYGTNPVWDFRRNSEAITAFWEDGIVRNKGFESLITVGMRGEADSALEGSEEENVALLKRVISTQKALLAKHGKAGAPKILAVYKEVEKYWYGAAGASGLRSWETLDDVTVMLCEDNYGNIRTLPEPFERDRKAGWGMYYHVDYHGGPISYEWVACTPLQKIWEQMTMAWDYGIREVWILNVGDLKPMELPISYFLDLAYDFDSWGTFSANRTEGYLGAWARQQFGPECEGAACEKIARLIASYLRLNGDRKPEATYPDTYSLLNFREGWRVMERASGIEADAERILKQIPESRRETFWQLAYYPSAASANVVLMNLYAGLSRLYARRGSVLANGYAELADLRAARDAELQRAYNETLAGGKWKGLMSSPHVGYKAWNSEGWAYPKGELVEPVDGSLMIVDLEGREDALREGEASLGMFTEAGDARRLIILSNGGKEPYDFQAKATVGWIFLDGRREPMIGRVDEGRAIEVSIDWGSLDRSEATVEGAIEISSGETLVRVLVGARRGEASGYEPGTFLPNGGIVCAEAAHGLALPGEKGEWRELSGYGRSLSGLKVFPATISFDDPLKAPSLEFTFAVEEQGSYVLTAYFAPSNNLTWKGCLRYAVAIDGTGPVAADALPQGYVAGFHGNAPWCQAVLDNVHRAETRHDLDPGFHTLRFFAMDAGLVLQKWALSILPLPSSHFGPEESARVGASPPQPPPTALLPPRGRPTPHLGTDVRA